MKSILDEITKNGKLSNDVEINFCDYNGEQGIEIKNRATLKDEEIDYVVEVAKRYNLMFILTSKNSAAILTKNILE